MIDTAALNSVSTDFDVETMDFKELRTVTAELYTAYIKLRRCLETADDNHNSDISRVLSAISATNDEVKIAMSKTDDLGAELSAELTVTAEQIQSNVMRTVNGKLQSYSTITQTASKIESVVGEIYDTSTYFTMTKAPTDSNTTDEQKKMLCLYDGTYYYFSPITHKWREIDEDCEVKSKFVQTSAGFEITGDVAIDGDLIVDGTITASKIDTEELSCTKLYSPGVTNEYYWYAKIDGGIGDFGIYSYSAASSANPSNEKCLWGVYNSTTAVNFYSCGNNYAGYNYSQEKFYPKGVWDFSSCEVAGLFDSSGGDVTT